MALSKVISGPIAEAVARALEGATRAVGDESKLQKQIARCFEHAGIPYKREAEIRGGGRVDFVVEGKAALEVKAYGGGGLGPIRQLLRYLDAEVCFSEGILVTVRQVQLPMVSHIRADGTAVALSVIRLWGNSL